MCRSCIVIITIIMTFSANINFCHTCTKHSNRLIPCDDSAVATTTTATAVIAGIFFLCHHHPRGPSIHNMTAAGSNCRCSSTIASSSRRRWCRCTEGIQFVVAAAIVVGIGRGRCHHRSCCRFRRWLTPSPWSRRLSSSSVCCT